MRSRVLVMTLVLAASAVAVPLIAYASASIPFFGPIVPDCPGINAPGWGYFLTVINNLIAFLLTLLIVFIAPLILAYAGFLLVVNSVNPAGKERAKKLILNLIIGLVIALASWLIVNLVMTTLYDKSKLGGTEWYDIISSGGAEECLMRATALSPAPPGGGLKTLPPSGGGGGGGSPGFATQAEKDAAEAAMRADLLSAGLSVNKGPCPLHISYTAVSGGCTDVSGLRPSTINLVKALKSACGVTCDFMITGGSELGHESGAISHASGHKIDLSESVGLGSFINNNFTHAPPRGAYPAFTDLCGNVYVYESDKHHWDISVTSFLGSACFSFSN